MKNKIIYGLIFIAVLFLSSCKQWIDTSLNVDPTAPQDATLATILPATQIALGYVLGGDYGRLSSMFTQHHKGIARQHLQIYKYNLNESDLDNAWYTMYLQMNNLSIIMQKAKGSSPAYQGIAEVLMSLYLGSTSDLLGDIPYSQAFLGNQNLKPKFDTQQSIYNSIQALLDSAIIHLGITTNLFKPGVDDIIYSGNKAAWIKAANTLKARYYLHVKNYSQALAVLPTGLAGSDDFQLVFGNSETQANPLYQFMEQRGDISMDDYFMNLMSSFKDPRIVPFTGDTVYSSSATPGPFYTSANSPVPFITYAEAKFIEAEAQLAGGGSAPAYKAYTDAITASMKYYGIADAVITAYLAQPTVAVGATNLTLQNIIEQKYIALYTQQETWSDYRRTGFPKLTPVSGTQIPSRFIYPQNERLYNGDNLKNATGYSQAPTFIFSKIWWNTLWP